MCLAYLFKNQDGDLPVWRYQIELEKPFPISLIQTDTFFLLFETPKSRLNNYMWFKNSTKLDKVVYVFDPSTQESKTGG